VFFYIVIAFSILIIAHPKKRFHLDYMKRLNIFFQDWVFGHRVAFIQMLARKDCDHSPVLVCTRGVFDHRVMFGGGHVYPTLQNF
jgi:hypothetical protein